MIRLDPATASSSAPPAVPAWALTGGGALNDADAAFRAGAALASLDVLARAQASWAGAWRQRLALNCAAASMMVLFLFLFLLFSICRRSSPTKNAGRVDHPPENYRGQSG